MRDIQLRETERLKSVIRIQKGMLDKANEVIALQQRHMEDLINKVRSQLDIDDDPEPLPNPMRREAANDNGATKANSKGR
jgi:hypothetical protein